MPAGFTRKRIKPVCDVVVTLAAWTYFIFGFLLFFTPFYALALIIAPDREAAFQRLNHTFLKIFFFCSGYSFRSSLLTSGTA